MQSKKILHIIDGFGMGGAETWLLSWTKYIFSLNIGMINEFLCTGGEKRVLDDEIEHYGGKIYYYKYRSKNLISFWRYLSSLLKSGKYNALWHHGDYVAGLQLIGIKKSLPRYSITYLHNPINQTWFYRQKWSRRILYYIGKYLIPVVSSHLTGTSNTVMNQYGYNRWPFYRIRIKPIHCAFDTRKFIFSHLHREEIREKYQIKDEHKVILFVGRMRLEEGNNFQNQKNPEFALSIAKSVCSVKEEYIFLFCGDKGETGTKYEDEIHKLGYSKRILFADLVPDVYKYYSAGDLLILPSTFEGLGMVAVEAQATGLPVIISDKTPTEAIVDDTLVKQLPLDLEIWINYILQVITINDRKEKPNTAIEQSDFNIKNSIQNIYSLLTD